MAWLLVRHKVKDYEKFKEAFFGHLNEDKNNGSQGGYIFRNKDNPNEVFVLVKWDNLDNFKKVAGSRSAEEVKEKAGLVNEPEGWFFEEVEEFSKQ